MSTMVPLLAGEPSVKKSEANATPNLPAWKMVETPPAARRWARILLILLFAMPFLLLLTPYQQAISGSGELIAYAQEERVTPINAPVEGRVVKWYVKEGQFVKKGEPVVDIQDNDPKLVERLREQKSAVLDRKKATQARVQSITAQIARLTTARDEAIRAASERLEAARRDVIVSQNAKLRTEAALKLASETLTLQEALFKDNLGLTSRIDYIRAQQDVEDRKASVEQAKAGINKAEDMVRSLSADVQRITNSENAVIEAARANLETANDSLAAVERDVLDIDIRLARQGQQQIKSEVDGIMAAISPKSTTGQLVKTGDLLAEIVPTMTDPVVEMYIDGNDMPLLMGQVGQHVRLQFEGYPAVQFVGWPSVAFGTFGGRVRVVDPIDDGKGRFRILVEPDPEVPGDEWPGLVESQRDGKRNVLLRQGMRANGWVFLNRVTLGWELWRRINGFPPVVAPKEPDKVDDKPPKFIKKVK